MIETNGVFWGVGHIAEFAYTKTGRRSKKCPPFTKLGWYATTYGDKILAEGCATAEEAQEKGRAALLKG